MADYIKINPNAKKGELSISKEIFEEIALDSIARNVKNAELIDNKPIKVSFLRNGKVKVVVSLASGDAELSKKVNEAISNALFAYVESVPFEVAVKVEASK